MLMSGNRRTIWRVASMPFSSGMPMSRIDHVGLQRQRLAHGFASVARLRDDFPVRLLFENLAQPLPHQRVIVAEQNAELTHARISDDGFRHRLGRLDGGGVLDGLAATAPAAPRSAACPCPERSRDAASRAVATTRSRMPTRPRPRSPPACATAAGSNPAPSSSMVISTRVRQPLEVDAADGGVRVFGDVGQRLLDDAIGGGLGFRREPFVHAVVEQVDADAVALAEAPQVPLDRGRQSQVVEQRRMEQVGQIAHRVQRAVGDRPRIVQHVRAAAAGVDRALRRRRARP